MIIAVIGSSNPPQQELIELGEGVGRELARRGATVVCGGLSGVMEAVCRGAKSEGGATIGILPGRVPTDANEYVDIPIVTTMGYSRNIIVVHTGAAVIAVGGAFGTLCEIAYALDAPDSGSGTQHLAVYYYRRRHGHSRPYHSCRQPSGRGGEGYCRSGVSRVILTVIL